MLAAGVESSVDRLEHLEQVIRAEFTELPGMLLTRAQFRRLWNLTDEEFEEIVTRLLKTGFLARAEGECYCRSGRAAVHVTPEEPRSV